MITLQWTNFGQTEFRGQEYMDAQYTDALADYARKKDYWDHIRIILTDDNDETDWIVIRDAQLEKSR